MLFRSVSQSRYRYGEWDEDKVMLGWDDLTAAKAAYLSHYNSPKFFGSIDVVPMSVFKEKVMSKTPIKITASTLQKGDPVTVDGFQGRGVVKKIEGRMVTVRFWSTEYVTRDIAYVHPFTENTVNRMWKDGQHELESAREWLELQEGAPVDNRRPEGAWIEQQGTQYCVKTQDADKTRGCYPSMEQAEAVMNGKSFTGLETLASAKAADDDCEWITVNHEHICIRPWQDKEKAIRDYRDWETDRKSTRLNSSHEIPSRMPSSA